MSSRDRSYIPQKAALLRPLAFVLFSITLRSTTEPPVTLQGTHFKLIYRNHWRSVLLLHPPPNIMLALQEGLTKIYNLKEQSYSQIDEFVCSLQKISPLWEY